MIDLTELDGKMQPGSPDQFDATNHMVSGEKMSHPTSPLINSLVSV